jgi:hypothetical protein
MPIKNLWLNTKLQCLETFLDRAFKVDDYYTRAVTPPESGGDPEHYANTLGELECAFGVLIEYQNIVFRALYLELNALVELELEYLARSTLSARGEKPGRLDRRKLHAIIEHEWGVSLTDLPSYDEVDRIRKIANAYKHDDGFSGTCEAAVTDEGTVLVYQELRYKLSRDSANRSIRAVREFLQALPGERQPFSEVRSTLADGTSLRVP